MTFRAEVAALLADDDVDLMTEGPGWLIWLRSVYEVALLVAAVTSVWLLVVDEPWAVVASWAVWAWFAADYLTRLFVAEDRRAYVATHRLELVAALPLEFFRPLRAVRLLRPLAMLARSTKGLRDVLGLYGLRLLLVIGIAGVWGGGVLFAHFEGGSTADGIWWAIVTTTTVGYGDISPASVEGRVLAGVLMVTGIGLLGGLTAQIAERVINHVGQEEATDGSSPTTATSGDPDVDHVIDRLRGWSDLGDDERRRLAAMLLALASDTPGVAIGSGEEPI